MAATVKRNIWFHSSLDGTVPTRQKGYMAASQGVLIPNSLVYLSASGTWKAADTTDGSDAIHGLFVGLEDPVATWPITSALDGTEVILVDLIRENDRFCIYCQSNGSDSVVAQTNVGNDYGLTIETGTTKVGYATMDINSATNTGVVVVNMMSNIEPLKYSTSDEPGVALVRFETAILEAQKA